MYDKLTSYNNTAGKNCIQPYGTALMAIIDGFNVYLQNRIALNLNQITKLFSCCFYCSTGSISISTTVAILFLLGYVSQRVEGGGDIQSLAAPYGDRQVTYWTPDRSAPFYFINIRSFIGSSS